MTLFRLNPPLAMSETRFGPIRRAARKALRGPSLHREMGCGSFGCVYPDGKDRVVKVTTDPYEVKVIRQIQRLRAGVGV